MQEGSMFGILLLVVGALIIALSRYITQAQVRYRKFARQEKDGEQDEGDLSSLIQFIVVAFGFAIVLFGVLTITGILNSR
jgi:ABC-type Fe3+ transport system permease subunit